MPTEISVNVGKDRYGISTSHHLMDNGERRFRLRSTDGTAYVRTEADDTGGWQNSHYHRYVQETYVVQSGWMGFAELIDGQITIRLAHVGDVLTTRPGIVHNVYLPPHAVIHTVKHGTSKGEDRLTDGDAPAFDLVTKPMTEAALRAAAMYAAPPVKYSDEYRHFDTLIWQAPAWSAAIFALSIQSLIELWKDSGWKTPLHWTGWLIVLMAATLLTFSIVLSRFRSHQRPLKLFSATPIWRSASSWTQSLISLQSMVLLGIGLVLLGLKVEWAVLIGGGGWLLLVGLLERGVRKNGVRAR